MVAERTFRYCIEIWHVSWGGFFEWSELDFGNFHPCRVQLLKWFVFPDEDFVGQEKGGRWISLSWCLFFVCVCVCKYDLYAATTTTIISTTIFVFFAFVFVFSLFLFCFVLPYSQCGHPLTPNPCLPGLSKFSQRFSIFSHWYIFKKVSVQPCRTILILLTTPGYLTSWRASAGARMLPTCYWLVCLMSSRLRTLMSWRIFTCRLVL